MKRLSAAAALSLLLTYSPLFGPLLFGPPLFAEVLQKIAKIGPTTVVYKVILPNHYDPAKAYPAVMAFAGGAQTMDMVDFSIRRFWQKEAEARGYIVVLPAAPGGIMSFEGSEKIFPEFLAKILADYKIQDNKFHSAGFSNGGISAFHVAASNPQYFESITGFPGYLQDASPTRLKNVSRMCIYMYVGETDSGWVDGMQQQATGFNKMGVSAKFSIEKGQGHIMGTLTGDGAARLFDGFDAVHNGCAIK